MEAVLLTVPISFINMKENQGVKGAGRLRKLKQNIDRPLSAILSMNTISHTVGAAGVGAQAVAVFGELYFGWISAGLTILILLFSEILPKTIGTHYWKKLVIPSAIAIQVTMVITYPLVLLSEMITKIVSKKESGEVSVSREEFSALVDIGEAEGVLDEAEGRILHNIIKLKSIRVESIMTPRVVVATAPESMTIEEFYKNKDYLHFSRIPIYSSESEENITGFVYRHDVIENLVNDNYGMKLSEIKRPIAVAPNSQPLTILWEKLLAGKTHIAIVVDEYGGFEGVVTLEDVIETILGLEITDERDVADDMQRYARERWQRVT